MSRRRAGPLDLRGPRSRLRRKPGFGGNPMRRIPRALAVVIAAVGATPAPALGICVEGAYPPFSEIRRRRHHRRLRHRHRRRALRRDRRDLRDGADPVVADDPRAGRRRLRRHRRVDVRHPRAPRPDRLHRPYYRAPVRFVGRADAGLGDAPEAMARQGGRRAARHRQPGLHDRALPGDAAQALRQPGARAARPDPRPARRRARRGGAARRRLPQDPGRPGLRLLRRAHFDPAIQGTGAAIGVRKADTGSATGCPPPSPPSAPTAPTRRSPPRYFDFDIYGG